jgi:hypothetical protein
VDAEGVAGGKEPGDRTAAGDPVEFDPPQPVRIAKIASTGTIAFGRIIRPSFVEPTSLAG